MAGFRLHAVVCAGVITLAAVFAVEAQAPLMSKGVEVGFENSYPFGQYGEYVTSLVGGGARVYFESPSAPNLQPFAGLGYAYGLSKDTRIRSINDITVLVGAGYILPIFGSFSVVPELGYGIDVHIVTTDLLASGTATTTAYSDQYLQIKVKFGYRIQPSMSLFLSPTLDLFSEAGGQFGILSGAQLGFRFDR